MCKNITPEAEIAGIHAARALKETPRPYEARFLRPDHLSEKISFNIYLTKQFYFTLCIFKGN